MLARSETVRGLRRVIWTPPPLKIYLDALNFVFSAYLTFVLPIWLGKTN